LVGRVLPSVGHFGRQPAKKLPSSGQSTAQLSGSDGAIEPSYGQYSFGQHASRHPLGMEFDPDSQTLTQKPVAGAPTGHALRQPNGFSSDGSSGQISTHVSSSMGPTLLSGQVVVICVTGAVVGISVRFSGQQASRQPAGSEFEPGSQITAQGPFAFGQRSVQNEGRVPLAGQTETHLPGSSGARLPSGQVGMIFATGTELGKSDTSAGG
jgi:hypothetical protein